MTSNDVYAGPARIGPAAIVNRSYFCSDRMCICMRGFRSGCRCSVKRIYRVGVRSHVSS